jgi:olfactory receptor
MLVNFVTEKNIIAYPERISQLYFLVFAISEYHILATMAICNPLIYNVYSWMIVGIYSMGLIGAMAHTVCIKG